MTAVQWKVSGHLGNFNCSVRIQRDVWSREWIVDFDHHALVTSQSGRARVGYFADDVNRFRMTGVFGRQ